MPHDDSLILTLVAGFVLAFVLGMLALRFKLSPIVGYLLAGVVVGPFTPGWTADTALAAQLAEVGVILLMFTLGIEFSFTELRKLHRQALGGGGLQVGVTVLAGTLAAVGLAMVGWMVGGLLGFMVALSSTALPSGRIRPSQGSSRGG